MAVSLQSISSNPQIRAPRILLLGVEKIGKTSFACGCRFEGDKRVEEGLNAPIVLPMQGEEGVDDLAVPSFPTIRSFSDALECIAALFGEHSHRTVVTDSASAMEALLWRHVCQQHNVASIEDVGGGYGKGYTAAADEFRHYLNGLDALRERRNMASIIIGHVKVKRFDDPNGDSYDTYAFDVNDKIANMIMRWADLILFANTKTVVKTEDKGFGAEKKRGIDIGGGARFVYTKKRPAHPGGGRGIYGELPYELPLDWSAFETAVDTAINNRSSSKKETK